MGGRSSSLAKQDPKQAEADLLDKDSMSVVLSFCDIRTRMQIDRTCTEYHGDVQRFHEPYVRVVSELRTIVATGEVSTAWLHIMRSCLPAEWTSALLRVWIHAPKSRVRMKEFAAAPGIVDALRPIAHTDWCIPRHSHLVNRRSWLGTDRVPVCMYLTSPASFKLFDMLAKHPHIWYGILQAVLLAIEYKIYNVCFMLAQFAVGT